MKIAVIVPRFIISGVSLAQHRFARALAARGHDVDLIIGRIDPGLSVPPSPGVRVVHVNVPQVRHLARPLYRYLRRERPDMIFSAEDHLNILVSFVATAARSTVRISGSSRVNPFETYASRWLSKGWLLKQLARLSYRRADAVTCVSAGMVEQYREVFGRDAPHVPVYNMIDATAARMRGAEAVDEPWLDQPRPPTLIAAGSLQPWKGFATLIDAMHALDLRGRDARLIILGEGPLRASLEAQITALGLADRVKLAGHTDNPHAYYSRAELFVLSSTLEGMPNVLVEAMALGCTPVATDCPTGPRELLADGRYGYLVPVGDARAMADAIEQALDHPIAPELLAEAILPFAEDTVIARHFTLLGVDEQTRAL